MTNLETNSTCGEARGWLLDLYPSDKGQVTLWIVSENGKRLKFTDNFQPKMYVSGQKDDLENLISDLHGSESAADWRFVEKKADIMHPRKSTVLEITISDCRRTPYFARKLLRLGGHRRYQLHNVDVPGAQLYLYDHQLFPLAFLEIQENHDDLSFKMLDSVASTEYRIPPLRKMWIDVETGNTGKLSSFHDPLKRFEISCDGEKRVIQGGDERQRLLEFIHTVEQQDPDLIFTHGGDSYLFPYLARRAMINDLLYDLILGREDLPLKARKRRGTTFFSYGRVYYKAPIRRLHGRVHIDVDNSFIYPACGLPGLIEVSRTCRVPLHKASRASIGTIMSSLQLYQATQDDILIPWKKREAESFKSAWDLLVADRGGFVFEPRTGLHERVAEIDFSCMYPTLMATRNISGETVLCPCCPDSENRVPELDYHICEKRTGIVPEVLQLVLNKRRQYKKMRDQAEDSKLREVYDGRQSALKWILVTCFGYLGYKNARFGKVDAHIAVCAFARDTLLRAVRIAENHGFQVVHGIVDSLWVKKEEAASQEYTDLCTEISQETNIPMNLKGRYRWIVFLPSKTHPGVPVLNRYYGVFEDGRVKVRGVEARRRDTPQFIRDAQMDMVNVLAEASDAEEFKDKVPHSLQVLRGYAEKLVDRSVPNHQLIIAKQLSKHPDRYTHNVHQAIAARQLIREGVNISAGQTMRYLITDAHHRKPHRRVKAAELAGNHTRYDVKKYLDLLLSAGANILRPFGYTKKKLRNQVVYQQEQLKLPEN